MRGKLRLVSAGSAVSRCGLASWVVTFVGGIPSMYSALTNLIMCVRSAHVSMSHMDVMARQLEGNTGMCEYTG
jgi:hypothetical protein